MINARYMYLRPGNLYHLFYVESTSQEITSTGRVANVHTDYSISFKGCLADASDDDRQNHSTKDHIVTHVIEQPGRPKAKRNDKLRMDDRFFYIVDVDDCGSLGIATLYYAEERRDLK